MQERDIGYEVVSTAAESHLDRDASEVSSISISERSRDEHSSGAKPRVRIVKSMPISSTRHRRDTGWYQDSNKPHSDLHDLFGLLGIRTWLPHRKSSFQATNARAVTVRSVFRLLGNQIQQNPSLLDFPRAEFCSRLS